MSGASDASDPRVVLRGLAPDDLIDAYERLAGAGAGGRPLAEAAAFFGDATVAERLRDHRMALTRPGSPPMLLATDLAAAVEGALAVLQGSVARSQRDLLDGHRRLRGLLAMTAGAGTLTGTPGTTPGKWLSVLTDPQEITQVVERLVNGAVEEVLSLDTWVFDEPPDDASALIPPAALVEQGVAFRTIYGAEAADNPLARRLVETCVAAGERARVLPGLVMKMRIVDRHTALLPLTPAGASAALLVRSASVIEGLYDYFELLWRRATPAGEPRLDHGLTANQRLVLHYLAQGHADEVIARKSGIGLRTVRRHIATLMDRLGAPTRFAAGAAAQREGWLT